MPDLEERIAELAAQDTEFKVITNKITIGSDQYYIIGVMDINKEHNLFPYQNMTYFVAHKVDDTFFAGRGFIIDPGIITGKPWHEADRGLDVRDTLGIDLSHAVFTHGHIDHCIGFAAYPDLIFHATNYCSEVLMGNASLPFATGQIEPHHNLELPDRVLDYARESRPFRSDRLAHYSQIPQEFPIQFYEFPGQTLGSLYGVMHGDDKKFVFAGDLFGCLPTENGLRLYVEPDYSDKSVDDSIDVMENQLLVLKAIAGQPYEPSDRHKPYQDIEHLPELANPDVLFLGHGPLEMNETNRAKVEELIHDVERIVEFHRDFDIPRLIPDEAGQYTTCPTDIPEARYHQIAQLYLKCVI